MNPLIYLAAVPAVLVLCWWVACFNRLVKLRNHVAESWSDVDTELTRRWDLVPQLVEVVKGYSAHEAETLTRLTALRQQTDVGAREAALDDELQQLAVRVEAYPDLKANENYLSLQKQLVDTEDRIQAARRFHNSNVRSMNVAVEQLPSGLVARVHGFALAEYFRADADARQAPSVS